MRATTTKEACCPLTGETAEEMVNSTANGIRRGVEQVVTYLIGAGIVGIILTLWNLNSAVQALNAKVDTQTTALAVMVTNVDQLAKDVGVLSGRLEQFSTDTAKESSKR